MASFRDYVAQNAKQYLGYVGNDITGDLVHGVNRQALAKAYNVNDRGGTGYNQALSAIQRLAQGYLSQGQGGGSAGGGGGYSYGGGGGGGGGGGAATVYAPKLDIAQLNASARSAAEGAVNPYYTKVLNEFLAGQAQKRSQQQAQYDMNIKNLEDSLKQILEGNEQTRGRTTEDVATNQAQINQTEDQFQTDSGQQANQDRLALARNTTTAGLTGGLGAQQAENATIARNTTEGRQEQDLQKQRDAQALFKGRTFEDLARSDFLKQDETTKGKTQEKFNLDTYIQNSLSDEANQRNSLEKARLQDIAQNQAAQTKLQFQKWIATIANPAQRAAAISTYGGIL